MNDVVPTGCGPCRPGDHTPVMCWCAPPHAWSIRDVCSAVNAVVLAGGSAHVSTAGLAQTPRVGFNEGLQFCGDGVKPRRVCARTCVCVVITAVWGRRGDAFLTRCFGRKGQSVSTSRHGSIQICCLLVQRCLFRSDVGGNQIC